MAKANGQGQGNGGDRIDRIDERLEKLTARHEALTQTVEIIARMQKKNEEQFGKTGENIERLAEVFAGEHRQLLTAQVVLVARMDELRQAQAASEARSKEQDERIGVLVKMMDEWIRRNP